MARYVLSSFVVSVLLGGCAAVNAPDEISNDIEQQRLAALVTRDVIHATPNVFHFAGMYVEQLTKKEAVLPSWFYDKVPTSFNDMPLTKVADTLSKERSLNFEFRDGVELDVPITISRDKVTVGDILNSISSTTGYQYSITGNNVVLNKFATKVFPIRLIGGTNTYSIGKKELRAQNNSQSSGADEVKSDLVSATGDEYSVINGSVNGIEDIKLGVDAILGCEKEGETSNVESNQSGNNAADESENGDVCAEGASSKLLRSNNSILVRALPSQLEQVERYIDGEHELALRQVRVNITLITVEVNKNTQLSLDLDVLDSSFLGSSIGVKHITNAATGLIGGLDKAGETVLSHKNGSEVAIEALSKQGSILQSIVLRGVAMNNRMTQLTNINKVNYISDRPLQQTANVGTTTGIKQKVAESGTLLYMLPNIGENDVVLHVSTSQSALIRLDAKGDGDNQVESPVIDDKLLKTTLRLRPGRPVFIGGFSNNELKAVFGQSGVLAPGVSRSSVNKNVETVMMIDVEYI